MAGTPGTPQGGQGNVLQNGGGYAPQGMGGNFQPFPGQGQGLNSAPPFGGMPRPGTGQMPPMGGPRQGGPMPPTGMMPPQAPPGTQVISDPSAPGAGPWLHYMQMVQRR